MEVRALVPHCERLVAPLLDDLSALVNIDSGTYQPAGVAAVAEYLRPRFVSLGLEAEIVPVGGEMGPCLLARLPGDGPSRTLLLGHMDTVFPLGEPERRPFTRRNGRAYGPGIYDMKGGLLLAMYALRALREAGLEPAGTLTYLFNSDEEVGSPASHDLIEREAANSTATLVFEPTAAAERLTTARKGVGIYDLEVNGTAAHAGVEPGNGRSAILELAHKILALHALNGTISGVTVNVGVVAGGERANIVPDYARALIDLRAADPEGVTAIQAAIAQVAETTTISGTRARLTGSFAHLPFVQSSESLRLFEVAQAVGTELGLSLRGESTGGGSDGNTAAALGRPTLDGLGPVGGLAHNPGEYIEVGGLATRMALIAGLLYRLGEGVL